MIGFVEFEADGAVYHLPRMTPNDFIKIESELFCERRQQLLSDLNDAGVVDPKARLDELKKMNDARGDEYWAVVLANWTPQNAKRLVVSRLNLVEGNKPDINSLNISPYALLRLASELCNYDLDKLSAIAAIADVERQNAIQSGDMPMGDDARPLSSEQKGGIG